MKTNEELNKEDAVLTVEFEAWLSVRDKAQEEIDRILKRKSEIQQAKIALLEQNLKERGGK